jgi:UDP-N-acetylmuramate dehydrogenase
VTWRDRLPTVRGRLLFDEPMASFTWLRVGGPADVIFMPADEADLSDFLKGVDPAVPVLPLGVGSNTLVRDGGLEGVVVRLGKPFAAIEAVGEDRLSAGAAALDAQVAKAAARAGIGGLEFYAGIPGTIGGAVAMNAGCYGSETKQVLVEAHGVNRAGEPVSFTDAASFPYRHGWGGEEGVIVTRALFQGRPDEPEAVTARMDEITTRREATQPIREKTGGSTFKNPPGHSSWKLVDEAGWRGRLFGGAKFSELHSNFLINTGEATAADLEGLGEAVRADVQAKTGIQLEWEVKRVGRPGMSGA